MLTEFSRAYGLWVEIWNWTGEAKRQFSRASRRSKSSTVCKAQPSRPRLLLLGGTREEREREKTHMTQRAIASRATFIVFLYMWHGLACFGQWKGCSRVFFCLVSSYRHAAFLLAALGRPFCFFCFLFPFSLSFLSLSAVLSADSAGCGRIGTAAAVHLMRRAPGPLEVRQGVASYSDWRIPFLHISSYVCTCLSRVYPLFVTYLHIFQTELPSTSKTNSSAFRAFHALPLPDLPGDLGRSQARTGQGGGRGGESRGLFREILLSCPKNQKRHLKWHWINEINNIIMNSRRCITYRYRPVWHCKWKSPNNFLSGFMYLCVLSSPKDVKRLSWARATMSPFARQGVTC